MTLKYLLVVHVNLEYIFVLNSCENSV